MADGAQPVKKPKRSKKRLAHWEVKELRDGANLHLDNLLLRLDNQLAGGRIRYAPFKPTRIIRPTMSKPPKQGRGRPTLRMVNGLKPFIKHLVYAKDVLRLPGLDDIMSGAVAFDCAGNTRPLNKKKLAALLQRLELITAEEVQKEMRNCSLRHAQKVASCLRTVVTLGLRQVDSWPRPPDDDDEFGEAQDVQLDNLTAPM
jgi:hypothetical protein